jgi:hypothetical protein
MISFFEKRSPGWIGVFLSCILVMALYIIPMMRQIHRYAFIYKDAFNDSAPTLIVKNKHLEFAGTDSVIIPLKNNIRFIFNSEFDSSAFLATLPGSVALSQNAVHIRLSNRIMKISLSQIKIDTDYWEIPPADVENAIVKYTFLVLFIATFVILVVLFLAFLLLCLLAAGLCSVIDSFSDTIYGFKLFFQLSGTLLFICVVSFMLMRFEFARIGMVILLYFLITVISYVLMVKYFEKRQMPT